MSFNDELSLKLLFIGTHAYELVRARFPKIVDFDKQECLGKNNRSSKILQPHLWLARVCIEQSIAIAR